MSKKIILIEGYGQLANRLIQYAHLIGFAKENGYSIYNPDFKRYGSCFKGSFNQKIPFFGEENKKYKFPQTIYKIIKILFKIIFKIIKKNFYLNLKKTIIYYIDNKDDFLLKNFLNFKNETFFINGWKFRDYENVKKHHSTIVKYFEIVDQYQKEVDNFILPLKDRYDTIVALHIRRGDYKKWLDGKYYFSDEVYSKYLLQLKELLNDKKLIFVIFSDEKIEIDYYKNKGLNVIQSNGNMVVDLYRMALCDYIIGPVSTFNYWAAYYGKKPHRYIENQNEIIKLEDFKIVESL